MIMTSDTILSEVPLCIDDNLIPNPSYSNNLRSKHPFSARTRVLIVEENVEMREHFEHFLGDEFDLLIVATPEEAVITACSVPIQIIIQDIEYEKEFESVLLTRQLKKLDYCSNAYFISVTGYVLPEGKSILKRATYDYHLAKPFTLQQLRELLRRCVAKQTISILNNIKVEFDLPIGTTMTVMV